nr:hypothetical protein [Tanacetum cinerariifolium]
HFETHLESKKQELDKPELDKLKADLPGVDSNALTISLSSATSAEIAGVEEFKLTLAMTALARV